MLAFLADHDAELCATIEAFDHQRLEYVTPRADDAGGYFDKTCRHSATLPPCAFCVVRIIATDSDNLAATHRRIKPAFGEWNEQILAGESTGIRFNFNQVTQPAIGLGERLPGRCTDMQKLCNIRRQKDRRQLATLRVADILDQITRIASAQIGHYVVADQHAEASLRGFLALAAVA